MKMIQERLRSLAARLNLKKQKKGYEKQVPISSKLLPVYVGDQELEGNLKRYDVPVACTSSIIFQALLRQFDDILAVDEGPITLSCSKQMFESVLKLSLDGLRIEEATTLTLPVTSRNQEIIPSLSHTLPAPSLPPDSLPLFLFPFSPFPFPLSPANQEIIPPRSGAFLARRRFCNSAICIDNDPAKQRSIPIFRIADSPLSQLVFQLNNLKVAVNLAKRGNLPGAENLKLTVSAEKLVKHWPFSTKNSLLPTSVPPKSQRCTHLEKQLKSVTMKEEDVNRCQIQEWYPKFKPVSIRTVIHELPESFVEYLVDDSGPFLLPLSISGEDALPNRIHNPIDEEDYQVSEGPGDEFEQPPLPPSFPELELNIKESINTLGGAVFPKLNWSAPKDSAWISTSGTLRCTSFSEIALLLRSSDSLVHDLCHAYDSCIDKTLSRPPSFFLALRKWYSSFLPEMEFRCFVRGQQLVGISQREVTTFYPTLLEKKNDLELLIKEFFTENVRQKFESENYTFDVYVTTDGRAKILDFNPWGAFTLPLLFTWEELEQNLKEVENVVDFRIVESQCGIRPGLKTAVPQDYLDTGPGSGWDQFLRKADRELQQQKMAPGNGA